MLPEDREVAAVAAAVGGDLLVGQHGAQTGAPIDQRVTQVHETVLVDHRGALGRGEVRPGLAGVLAGEFARAGDELVDQLGDASGLALIGVEPGVVDLQEDPLCPAVEVDVCGRDTTTLVVAEAEASDLTQVALDVLLGRRPRVCARLDGVLLGGQPEGVEAHRVQDVLAGHPLVAREDVAGDEAQRVADVQTRARGVGEHVLDEQLVGGVGAAAAERAQVTGQRSDGIGCLVGMLVGPGLLPALLELARNLRGVAMSGGAGGGVGAGGVD